jgi:hypothetical protein
VIAAKVFFEAPTFSADVIKNDIYDQMKPGFRFNAEKAPTVLVVDDAQWADQASVHLILHLMQLTREVPVLFLCAFRPDRQSPAWTLKRKIETDFGDRYTEITLQPLEAGDANALISALLNIADLPDELRQLILRKADGNPYFVEEIVRTLIEQGIVYETEDRLHWRASTKVADITIPDTLQALLMARIDRLDQEAKSTLQVASVIGRSFYYRILKAISESAIALDKQLGSLQRMELLREAERMPELEYIFKHELARDAAYGSILNRNGASCTSASRKRSRPCSRPARGACTPARASRVARRRLRQGDEILRYGGGGRGRTARQHRERHALFARDRRCEAAGRGERGNRAAGSQAYGPVGRLTGAGAKDPASITPS